jgi:hypothetical protein
VPQAEPEQEPVAGRAFLERVLVAMEGVIDVADCKTDEFDALRSCIIELTLMLYTTPPAAQRQWVGLTEFQFAEIYNKWNDTNGSTPWGLNQALEAKLRKLNK